MSEETARQSDEEAYTQDECDIVNRIRNCKDYYEILNAQKDATDAHLKKEYYKMALQLHPDKCRAPGATDAFKALGKAYKVLSDSKQRRRYDIYGNETDSPQVRNRYEFNFAREFEAEFTKEEAEELFRFFASVYRTGTSGYPTGTSSHPTGARRHAKTNDRNRSHTAQKAKPDYRSGAIFLVIAIGIIGLFAFFMSMVEDQAFSLERSGEYTDKRITKDMRVIYYVKADFLKNYNGRVQQVGKLVENRYLEVLRSNCLRERSEKTTVEWKARLAFDTKMWDRAQRMSMPNCDKLNELNV